MVTWTGNVRNLQNEFHLICRARSTFLVTIFIHNLDYDQYLSSQ